MVWKPDEKPINPVIRHHTDYRIRHVLYRAGHEQWRFNFPGKLN